MKGPAARDTATPDSATDKSSYSCEEPLPPHPALSPGVPGEREPNAPFRGLRAILVVIACFITAPFARADGGLLTCTAVRDGRFIAVFTTPTPPRVGLLDISVLIQDQATGRPLLDVPVAVIAHPTAGHQKHLRAKATQDAATNKLMRAAQLALDQPGQWEFEVTLENSTGEPLRFLIDVEPAPPAWTEMRLWFAWPLAAIVFFAAHQWLVARKRNCT